MNILEFRMNLQKKLYLVYSLNVVDWICTLILLSSGRFFEANPIAATFIHSIYWGFVLKCVIPFLIIMFIFWGLRLIDPKQLFNADKVISFALVVYLAISLSHFVNFFMLFFY